MPRKTQPGFEECLNRLEEIVRGMEGGKLSLDETTALYEEGVRLVAACRGKLTLARSKVTMLAEEGEGLKEVGFDDADA